MHTHPETVPDLWCEWLGPRRLPVENGRLLLLRKRSKVPSPRRGNVRLACRDSGKITEEVLNKVARENAIRLLGLDD